MGVLLVVGVSCQLSERERERERAAARAFVVQIWCFIEQGCALGDQLRLLVHLSKF